MSMISRSERRGVPRRLSDCNGKDPVSQRLWFWARMYERVALTSLWIGLLITVALVVLIVTNVLPASELFLASGAQVFVPIAVGVVGLILSLTAYFSWNSKAVNTASQAAMVENTRVCADVALYEAYAHDGNTPEIVVSVPMSNASPASASTAAYSPAATAPSSPKSSYSSAATAPSSPKSSYSPAATAPSSPKSSYSSAATAPSSPKPAYTPAATAPSSPKPAYTPAATAPYTPVAAAQPVSMGSPLTPSMPVMPSMAASAFAPAPVFVQEPAAGTIKTPSGNTMEFIRSVSAICSSCGQEKTCGEYRVIMPDGRNSKISHYCDECVAKKTTES